MTIVRKNPETVIPAEAGIQLNKGQSKRIKYPSASVRIRPYPFFLTLGLFILLAVRFTLAAEVAVLQSAKLEAFNQVVGGFRENFPQAAVFYLPEGGADQEAVLEQLRERNPAVILAVGGPAAAVLKERFKNVSIVYCMISDPRRFNLSGANVAGVVLKIRTQDQFQLFKKAFPTLSRIGLIYDPAVSGEVVAEARTLAKGFGFLLVERLINKPGEIADAVKDIIWEVDALWMIPDSTVVSKESFQYLLESSIEKKIPLLVFSEGFVKSGALLALAPDYPVIGRQAGSLVQKIIEGQSPGAIPPVYSQGAVAINLHTAKTLGISISPEVMKMTGRIY